MQSHSQLRVRVSDCDRLDHVNNAEYINYLCQASAEATGYAEYQRLRLRHLLIDYRRPATFGDVLTVTVWSGRQADGIVSHYQIVPENEELLIQAQAHWERTAAAVSLPASDPPAGEAPFTLKPAWRRAESEGKSFRWSRDVQLHDVSGSFAHGIAHLNPTSIIRWVEEAIWLSSAKRGWSITRMFEANSLVLMVQHDLSLFGDVSLGTELTIDSRIHELRKIRGTWRVDFFDGATHSLIATDHATGAFINREGALALPPPGLFAACLLGEPEKESP